MAIGSTKKGSGAHWNDSFDQVGDAWVADGR